MLADKRMGWSQQGPRPELWYEETKMATGKGAQERSICRSAKEGAALRDRDKE